MLEAADLHAFYGKSHILHGVHLRVGEGEIVSLGSALVVPVGESLNH